MFASHEKQDSGQKERKSKTQDLIYLIGIIKISILEVCVRALVREREDFYQLFFMGYEKKPQKEQQNS